MRAWGMARTGSGEGAVLRHHDRVLSVRDINEWTGAQFPLTLEALIRGGLTGEIEHLARTHGWFEARGSALEDIALTIPLPHPERVVGIGLNFSDHARDLGERVPEEPATFLKPDNTLRVSGADVVLPTASSRVTAEGEIALIFGRDARDVGVEEAPQVIWGAVAVLDLTAEDVLRRNPRFLTRAKGYDGFFVMSPWLIPWEAEDFATVRRIDTSVNHRLATTGTTEQMTYNYGQLVALVTAGVSIGATAILSTGTPGAAVIGSGDVVSADVEGLESVRFQVG